MADSLDAVRPSQFYVFSVEENTQLFGSGLVGNVATLVTFSGPAGTYTTEPQNATSTTLDVAVPDEVLRVVGRYSITVNAQDDNGSRLIGPAFLDVIPRPVEEPPLLTTPESVIAEATDSEGGVAQFTVTATTFLGTPLTPQCNHQSGARFSFGATSVTCSATDQFGTTTASFLVVLVDTVRPVLTLPKDIITDSRVFEYSATAFDAIDGQLPISCSPASGATFQFGTTTVQCQATDHSLNRVEGSFHVLVQGGTPPSLILPHDFSKEATGSTGVVVDYVVSTDADATVDCTPPSGLLFPLGRVTVECEAQGPNGTTVGAFFVTVTDTTPPALELPNDFTVDSNGPTTITYSARAIDLVDGAEVITCTPPSGSTFQPG
ncbi:MAG TPA: HYR domain-containing protein, partial [Thermoanaerobaculia bacterium]|nr:HYR domain-containing protein [Thermoanaerobaculia bacterium]